jgi:SAM-dependent methyltransferase
MWLPSGRRGRLLDVGSGNGEFLATMRDLGWEVVGLEPDYAAAAAARRDHGLDVILGTLEGATLDEASFDAVTLSHVIEHVPDPVQTIRECYRLLRRGGVLVVLTPNIASLCHRVFGADWRGLEPPRHLFLFSPETMRRCASAAGFSAVRIRTPARGTPYAWGMSRLLRTRRVSDGLSGRGLSSWGRVVALAMWLVEAGGVRLGVRWGEEVLIEAVKE